MFTCSWLCCAFLWFGFVYVHSYCFFFFVKQKTAYEMRISDWSSTCALPISALEAVEDGRGAGRRVDQAVVARPVPVLARVGVRVVGQVLVADDVVVGIAQVRRGVRAHRARAEIGRAHV